MKLTTIRSALNIVAAEDLHVKQLDVKITFLHGDLEVDIYMMQPHGYIMLDKEHLVCVTPYFSKIHCSGDATKVDDAYT